MPNPDPSVLTLSYRRPFMGGQLIAESETTYAARDSGSVDQSRENRHIRPRGWAFMDNTAPGNMDWPIERDSAVGRRSGTLRREHTLNGLRRLD